MRPELAQRGIESFANRPTFTDTGLVNNCQWSLPFPPAHFHWKVRMDCKSHIVSPDKTGGWIAKLDSRDAGPYINSDLALWVAVAEAVRLSANGQSVCVIVENDKGSVVATYCVCKRLNISKVPVQISGAM